MRSYPALRVTAIIVKIVTVLGALVGLYLGFKMGQDSWRGFSFTIALLHWAATFLSALLMWATAEILLAFANMGEDMSDMKENISTLVHLQRRAERRETSRSSVYSASDVGS